MRSVNIRVINLLPSDLLIMSMIINRLGGHMVLLSLN